MRFALAALVISSTLLCLPAHAASKKAQLRTPSPCDHVIPTGEPVPRQSNADAASMSGVLVYGSDRPAWNDKPVAIIGKDEPFTVIRECNMSLQVRDVRGVEGWVKVTLSQDEKRYWKDAQDRPAKTDADCELLYLDPAVIARCKAKLAATAKHNDEVKNGDYLSGDALRDFLRDKTLVLAPRDGPAPQLDEELYLYYSADGEIFVHREAPWVNWRGFYTVDDQTLCAPDSGTECGRIRRVGSDLIWASGSGNEFRIHATEGDTHRVVAEVSKRYPSPRRPPAPEGGETVAGPAMGQ